MSSNDDIAVDSDPSNITTSGFNLTLQEEEAQDGVHGAETVGWIAIEAGGDAASGTASTSGGFDENVDTLNLGATFTNSVVLGETQTINGPDTATVVISSQTTSTVGMFLEEEQSRDSERGHINETVGVVAFEKGLISCFTSGTRIKTPEGLVPVERLQVGDLVETLDHGPQPLRWVGRRTISAQELHSEPNLRPVQISAQALGGRTPQRDLIVSRQHRMLVASKVAERMFGQAEVLVAAAKLTALPGIFVDDTVQAVEYVHLLFDDHQLVIAEGALTESLYLGAEAQKALSDQGRSEIMRLFPELDARQAVPPARPIPAGRLQKKLIARHSKNAKMVLCDTLTA